MKRSEFPAFTQNRELSWLRFNERVLEEAADETVPLLERLLFVSIFTTNLDEFFMVRVGSLKDMSALKDCPADSRTGLSAKEQLSLIYAAVRPLMQRRELLYYQLMQHLASLDITRLYWKDLDKQKRKTANSYFKTWVLPVLSPQLIDSHHPFPHLENKRLYLGARVNVHDRETLALLPVPSSLPPLLFLSGQSFLRLEDLLLARMEDLFSSCVIYEKVILCVTRNADISLQEISDEEIPDIRGKMRTILKKRTRLAAVRLELSAPVSPAFLHYLCAQLDLCPEQVFTTGAPLCAPAISSLQERLSVRQRSLLCYRPFTPCREIPQKDNLFALLRRQDLLLHFPYDSMEPFLRLLQEAAEDLNVLSIHITIYRLARSSKLAEYLCMAAENGKQVEVLIELRARFDEQNNLDWSEQLEAAGCRIFYGLAQYKVHSKICLITRRERGKICHYTQIGTGNYNEKTACLYTDLSLMTADPVIGADAASLFHSLTRHTLPGTDPGAPFSALLVSPVSLKPAILHLIGEEQEKGSEGRIFLKLNSITDMDLIEKLKQASCAGVSITMVVRGICCLLPGIPGKTENIHITSIVGRFLEHSRIYCFGSGASRKMYLSSADFMTRNTEHRVEVACPLLSPAVQQQVLQLISVLESDSAKCRILTSDGTYCKKETPLSVDAQLVLMQQSEQRAVSRAHPITVHTSGSFWSRLRYFFTAVFS